MTHFIMAGLLLGATAAAPGPTVNHSVRVDHHGGAIDARYDGNVTVSYRQIGAASAPGRASTLRCRWSADMVVDRRARSVDGSTMTRSFTREAVMSGQRAGWCDTHRATIDREVAARMDDLHGHVRAMAADDHDVLRGELDRLHGPVRAG